MGCAIIIFFKIVCLREIVIENECQAILWVEKTLENCFSKQFLKNLSKI